MMIGRHLFWFQFALFLISSCALDLGEATTHRLDWKIQYTDVTRICHTKSIVSVNGHFPGPTVHVREGDKVMIKVTNLVSSNVTIHWHGIKQVLSAWADGPAYITQCPIQTGHSYVYQFEIIGQKGTLFWHAHIGWLKATLYGAFIIFPKQLVNYPFPTPHQEIPIVLGEWWNANVEDVVADALAKGGVYQPSDALTINGQPGDLYNCSRKDTMVYNVEKGQTYLLRLIHGGVNMAMYFAVTNHSLTVVEADGEYTKPYTTDMLVLAPGQTTNVLLIANQPVGRYYMAASVSSPTPESFVRFVHIPTTAIVNYVGARPSLNLKLPRFPVYNDTPFIESFAKNIRSLCRSRGCQDLDIPKSVDQDLFFTVGFAVEPCSGPCEGLFGGKLATSINNVTFRAPSISILQAYYNHIDGVYESDFPDKPPFQYNYTGVNPDDKASVVATKVKVLEFNTTVQIVYQSTFTLGFDTHPMHLHGQSFYVVGMGFGTFNPKSDPAKFNLLDPPFRNTVDTPAGGWTAIRFRAINPGVWYLHCHVDMHQSWGMSMAFIVKDGPGSNQKLPPPPSDLPTC